MIEKNVSDESMAAETAVPTRKQSPQHAEFPASTKSLLEDDEEEEEGEVLSRNPSLIRDDDDDDDDDGEHDTLGVAAAAANDDRVGVDPEVETSFLDYDEDESEDYGGSQLPMCQGDLNVLTGCHNQALAEQIDLMTRCQNPLDLFSFFQEHPNRETVEGLLPGMYSIPTSCEYCGEEDSRNCPPNCDRPKLYFRKKRPPFLPASPRWDPDTEYAVTPPPPNDPVERRSSFFSLFGGTA